MGRTAASAGLPPDVPEESDGGERLRHPAGEQHVENGMALAGANVGTINSYLLYLPPSGTGTSSRPSVRHRGNEWSGPMGRLAALTAEMERFGAHGRRALFRLLLMAAEGEDAVPFFGSGNLRRSDTDPTSVDRGEST